MIFYIKIAWVIISIIAVIYNDIHQRWKYLHPILFTTSAAAFILVGWACFNPNLSTYIGGVIEINPTWELSIIISFIIGACITGPFALLNTIKDNIKYNIEKKKRKER